MSDQPSRPWYRRYWGYAGRPFPGCGCAYAVITILAITAVLSWVFLWPPVFGAG